MKTDRWRLTNGEQLYDIKADPRQKTDVRKKHPEVVKRLRKKYKAYWKDLPQQEVKLSRHFLGADACPDVVLNGMDWYRGAKPWNKRAFTARSNGAWPVTIVRDGRYVFECRHYPRESNMPAEATHAKLKIGATVHETNLEVSATHARFEVDLQAGDYDLETFMSFHDKPPRGALFVYVSAK